MKALVTGANGLLGSHVVRELAEAGYVVRALVREGSNLRSLDGANLELVYGNVLNVADLRKALETCQVVVHAAARTVQWPSDYDSYYEMNVRGTELLLQASRDAGVGRFIYVGSANAFGPGTIEKPGTESTPFTHQQYTSGYMRSKFEAQNLAIRFAEQHHFPVVVVNPTFMLGPYDTKPSSGKILLMGYSNRIMPVPPGGKNFVHVTDVARGIRQAIEKGRAGQCYLLAGENLSYLQFFRKMKAVCGHPRYLYSTKPWQIHALGT